MQWDYFISYASEDRQRATELVSALELLGQRCFIDHRDIPPGAQQYRRQLSLAITHSETVLVVVSAFSQASDEVLSEVQFGHDHGRRKLAVWLSDFQRFSSEALAFLLATVQNVDWTQGEAERPARSIAAMATLRSLHDRLSDYRSVTDRLRLDLELLFRRVDGDDRAGAMAEVRRVAVAMLTQLTEEYNVFCEDGEDLHSLLVACRDHIEQESLLRSFVEIDQHVARAALKTPNLDSITRAVEGLMHALSVLRAMRWGLDSLDPVVRRNASFVSGLLTEAGWLVGTELAPQPGVVYLLFEKPVGNGKRYLELLMSKDASAAAAIARESRGQILRERDTPTASRFLVVDQVDGVVGTSGDDGLVITLDDFVLRFTGLTPPVRGTMGQTDATLANDVRRAIAAGNRNILIYGEPGTGKSRALSDLTTESWPGAPNLLFTVDFAESDTEGADGFLDEAIERSFHGAVRQYARGLGAYLVRSGKAALVLDSIELAANAANPALAARAFAGLCKYLSHESTVVIAGRDAALRDSAAVREFFLATPSTSAQLSQVMTSHGVDSDSLPRFTMLRARTHPALAEVSTPADRIYRALELEAWNHQEAAAARSLGDAIGGRNLVALVSSAPPLDRSQLESLALGRTPKMHDGVELDLLAGTCILGSRCLREFRAAIAYVQTVMQGTDTAGWDRIQIGESARRYIRLLAILHQRSSLQPYRLSLVGPPGAVLAVAHNGPVSLASAPTTVGQYSQFLEYLTEVPFQEGTFDAPNAESMRPLYERLPHRYFTDELYRDRPVAGVSWWAARAYARWRGAKLPSSLEWEIAGRSWDGRVFPWGDDPASGRVRCAESAAGRPLVDYAAWRAAMRAGAVAPANSRPVSIDHHNVSELGHLDLVGNVWEWTATELAEHRSIAGGSYDNPLRACTLASRSCARPVTRSNAIGFRLVTL